MKNPERKLVNQAFVRPGQPNSGRYADLAAVIDAVKPALAANGFAIIQLPTCSTEGVSVETQLLHVSGESLCAKAWVPINKQDAHGIGSAITYARRFSLMAICGLAPDDDDANSASNVTAPANVDAEKHVPTRSVEAAVARIEKNLGEPLRPPTGGPWYSLLTLPAKAGAEKIPVVQASDKNLSFWESNIAGSLDDPGKAKFRDKNAELLKAIQEEQKRRAG